MIKFSRRIIAEELEPSKGDACVADMQESESRNNKHIQLELGEERENDGLTVTRTMKMT